MDSAKPACLLSILAVNRFACVNHFHPISFFGRKWTVSLKRFHAGAGTRDPRTSPEAESVALATDSRRKPGLSLEPIHSVSLVPQTPTGGCLRFLLFRRRLASRRGRVSILVHG